MLLSVGAHHKTMSYLRNDVLSGAYTQFGLLADIG